MEILSTALFFSLVAQQLIEALVRPIKAKLPALDLWWLIYVTWLLGAALSWLAQLNLFSQLFTSPAAGQILTALVVGGGSQLVSSIFKLTDAAKAKLNGDSIEF